MLLFVRLLVSWTRLSNEKLWSRNKIHTWISNKILLFNHFPLVHHCYIVIIVTLTIHGGTSACMRICYIRFIEQANIEWMNECIVRTTLCTITVKFYTFFRMITFLVMLFVIYDDTLNISEQHHCISCHPRHFDDNDFWQTSAVILCQTTFFIRKRI